MIFVGRNYVCPNLNYHSSSVKNMATLRVTSAVGKYLCGIWGHDIYRDSWYFEHVIDVIGGVHEIAEFAAFSNLAPLAHLLSLSAGL